MLFLLEKLIFLVGGELKTLIAVFEVLMNIVSDLVEVHVIYVEAMHRHIVRLSQSVLHKPFKVLKIIPHINNISFYVNFFLTFARKGALFIGNLFVNYLH